MITLLLSIALQTPEPPLEVELYRAQMAAAEGAMRLGEYADARVWLAATQPSRRGFEWQADDALLDESLASVPASAGGHGSAIDVSPDGTRMVVGTSDGAVELRDATSGALLGELGRHAEAVTYARFDPQGERVVTASYDHTVRIWSVAERKQLAVFEGHSFPVGGVAFSPDGTLVASCSYERPPGTVVGTVHVWKAADGSPVHVMEGGRKPLVGIAWSPDGAHIAAGSWDFCAFVWPATGGEPVKCAVPDEGIYNACDDVCWTGDGAHIVTCSKDRTARVFDASSGALQATLRGHTDAVQKLAVDADGAQLATASADGTLKLWRTCDWSCVATLRGHGDDVQCVAFTPDGKRLWSSSLDGTLREWEGRASLYGGLGCTATHANYVAAFSPDDSRIALATYDGRVEVRDAATLDSLSSWQAHPEDKSCHALAWTPDGTRLVTGSWEPVVRVFDARMGKELAAFEQATGTYWLAVSPDGSRAAACSGKEVHVYDLERPQRIATLAGHGSTVLAVAFSPDSQWCVSSARDGKAVVWDARSGRVRCEITTESTDVADAQFTPDGLQVIVAGKDGKVDLYRADHGIHVRAVARLRHGVTHIDVSPDGTRLAVASHVTVLVDLVHGGVVGEQRRHVEAPYCCDFDSTGKRLVTGSTDKSVEIIDARPLREWLPKR